MIPLTGTRSVPTPRPAWLPHSLPSTPVTTTFSTTMQPTVQPAVQPAVHRFVSPMRSPSPVSLSMDRCPQALPVEPSSGAIRQTRSMTPRGGATTPRGGATTPRGTRPALSFQWAPVLGSARTHWPSAGASVNAPVTSVIRQASGPSGAAPVIRPVAASLSATVARQASGAPLSARGAQQVSGASLSAPVARQPVGASLTAPVARQVTGASLSAPLTTVAVTTSPWGTTSTTSTVPITTVTRQTSSPQVQSSFSFPITPAFSSVTPFPLTPRAPATGPTGLVRRVASNERINYAASGQNGAVRRVSSHERIAPAAVGSVRRALSHERIAPAGFFTRSIGSHTPLAPSFAGQMLPHPSGYSGSFPVGTPRTGGGYSGSYPTAGAIRQAPIPRLISSNVEPQLAVSPSSMDSATSPQGVTMQSPVYMGAPAIPVALCSALQDELGQAQSAIGEMLATLAGDERQMPLERQLYSEDVVSSGTGLQEQRATTIVSESVALRDPYCAEETDTEQASTHLKLSKLDDDIQDMVQRYDEARSGTPKSSSVAEDVFTIVLDRRGGGKLGINLTSPDGVAIAINSIAEEGLVEMWNQNNPGKQVQIGDQIVEVNHVPVSAETMMQQCESDNILHLTLKSLHQAMAILPVVETIEEVQVVQEALVVHERSPARASGGSAASAEAKGVAPEQEGQIVLSGKASTNERSNLKQRRPSPTGRTARPKNVASRTDSGLRRAPPTPRKLKKLTDGNDTRRGSNSTDVDTAGEDKQVAELRSTSKDRCGSNVRWAEEDALKEYIEDDEVTGKDSPRSSSASSELWDNHNASVRTSMASGRHSMSSLAGQALVEIASTTMRRHTVAKKHSVFSAAVAGVIDAENAKHPQRAEAGLKLLGDLRGTDHASFLETSGFQEGDRVELPQEQDSMTVVERLFFDSVPEEHVAIESVEQVVNPRLFRRFLKSVQSTGGCVEATFHGTPIKYADAILKEGLLKDLNTTAAYGRGAYVGAHAGVAHQYADPDGKGLRCMCVVLVNIGSSVVKGKMGIEAGVTAVDRVVNPTQYCFVDESRMIVSHIITYKASGGQRKRIGGGWHDPFERKLNEAIQKAARDRQAVGSL